MKENDTEQQNINKRSNGEIQFSVKSIETDMKSNEGEILERNMSTQVHINSLSSNNRTKVEVMLDKEEIVEDNEGANTVELTSSANPINTK